MLSQKLLKRLLLADFVNLLTPTPIVKHDDGLLVNVGLAKVQSILRHEE